MNTHRLLCQLMTVKEDVVKTNSDARRLQLTVPLLVHKELWDDVKLVQPVWWQNKNINPWRVIVTSLNAMVQKAQVPTYVKGVLNKGT